VADRSARFTGPAELVAYLAVQAAGLIWNFTVNAAIMERLMARSDRDPLPAVLALCIVTAAAALALFLLLRWGMAKAGKGERRALTDLTEIGAYLLAQAIGFVLASFVMAWVLASLRSGVQDLATASFVMNVVSILVVLLIFLFLRKAMTARMGRESRGGAAGFGFGLAFVAWVVVALTIGSDRGMHTGTSVSARLPWLFTVCVASSLAAWAGGSAAYVLSAFLQSRAWRAVSMTIIVPCIALPAVAVLAMSMVYGACAGQVSVGWVIRTGADYTVRAVIAGGVAFAAPCLLATLLWALYYLRPSR
jgi:hypothetical protein